MCNLLLILALIGPILPTPVPLDYFTDFRAVPSGEARARVSWRGTGGVWSLCVDARCHPQRWAAGANAIEVTAGVGARIELRDGGRVLAGATVEPWRQWFPNVRRAP